METEELTTAQHRANLQAMIVQELNNLPALLADLSPKERAELLCKLLPFVMAKEKSAQPVGIWD